MSLILKKNLAILTKNNERPLNSFYKLNQYRTLNQVFASYSLLKLLRSRASVLEKIRSLL